MNKRSARGFTLIEIMFVVGVIGVLSAIAAPSLTKARMAANESSAIASLRVIYSGQMAFSVSCGGGNYAPSLEVLSAPVGTAPGYVSRDIGITGGVKSGYELDMATDGAVAVGAVSCHTDTPDVVAEYHVTADPQFGAGTRYFGMNTGGGIFQSREFTGMPDSGVPPPPWAPLVQ
jgi:prepilin-type N-terminal cleavage/methylation domain-containing protein